MAEANQNYDSALKIGGSVMADVGGWLAVPVGKNDGRYELGFRFAPPAGSDYATAMPLVDGYHRLDAGDILYAGPLLLGKFERRSLDLPGPLALAPDSADPTRRAQVDLAFLDGLGVADADQLASWIGDTAQVNAGFWQGFPVAQSLVIVLPVDGRGLPFGRVLNRGGVTTLLLVGKESPVAELYQEWVLIHEFLHLGTPFIRDRGSWFNEGIATFYEPIVRFRAGWKSEDEVWLEWLGMMERGLPAMGEVGLSEARGGGVYWGGALYWLLAEIAERARSDLKHGAEDGLRALLIESGAIDAFDRTGSATATMDRALKGSTFGDLADAHVAGKGPPIDLQDLWARLGVAIGPDGKIVYDDNAPLAAVRAAIVAGGPAEGPKAGPGLVPVSAQ